MKVLKLLASYNRWHLILVLLLTFASAFMTITVIAFIKQRFLDANGDFKFILLEFSFLILGLLLTASAAQILLQVIGHRFVHMKRMNLVRKILNTDIEQLETIGGPSLLASLNIDIQNISMAFLRLPDLIYGATLTILAVGYLAFLAPKLLLFLVITLIFIVFIGWFLMIKINHYLIQLRLYADKLYHDYQGMIDGQKELSLNRSRVIKLFNEKVYYHSDMYRKMLTLADIFNGFAGHLTNTLTLALIGFVFYLSVVWQWSDVGIASTFALVLLFLRTPIFGIFGSIPTLVAANVSLDKIESLALSLKEDHLSAPVENRFSDFHEIEFKGVCFEHENTNEETGFQIGPLNLSIKSGEIVFVIGGNGSGKSTFAHLLTGLYHPRSGHIVVDGAVIDSSTILSYRQLYSAVFTDFFLFDQLISGQGEDVAIDEADEWIKKLSLSHKVNCVGGALSSTQFSQGQRKRLALMVAVLEKRPCLLLDEWAADQDPGFRDFFYKTLLPSLREKGKTIIAITHDEKYFDTADRVLKMDSGRLLELDISKKEVLARSLQGIILDE